MLQVFFCGPQFRNLRHVAETGSRQSIEVVFKVFVYTANTNTLAILTPNFTFKLTVTPRKVTL